MDQEQSRLAVRATVLSGGVGRADGAAPGAVAVHRVLTPRYEQVRERARRDAVLVDPGREFDRRPQAMQHRPEPATGGGRVCRRTPEVLRTGFRRPLEELPAVLRTVTKLKTFRVYGPS